MANFSVEATADDHFSDRVLPLLHSKCIACHGDEKQEGGLRLDSRAAALEGGGNGAAIVPGDADASLLVHAVRHATKERQMPPKEKLSDEQIADLAKWIDDGAPWPASVVVPLSAATLGVGDAFSDPRNPIVKLFNGQRLDLWSLKRPIRPALPEVHNAASIRTPIDRFVIAGIEANKLTPSPAADRTELIRRVYFDVLGLPPTPDEVEQFANDQRADAYETLVDRVLADPRHGAQLATMWLDAVRYADTHGYERDEFRPLMWRYRDYVIRSFNADKPYDEFLREQLAGDEMLAGSPKNDADADRLIATGYLRLGPYDSTAEIFEEQAKARNELLGDLVNTTGAAMLGLTLSCCNCHDHKYDPLSQADHFRLRAMFAAVKAHDDTIVDLPPLRGEIEAHNARVDAQIEPLQKQFDATPEDQKERREALAKQMDVFKAQRREFTRAATMTDEGASAPPTHIFYQGDFTEPRDEVAAGFLSYLDPSIVTIATPPVPNTTGRRTALAAWIASGDNPFTARVLVNRLWQQHFGRGIVETPSDFGYSGARPTHPELLDWLAVEFVEQGWSIRKLQRMMLLSAAYQQSSRDDEGRRGIDPDNRLFWRQNPRRLTAEMTRDAMLTVSGALLPESSGPPRWPPLAQELLEAQPGILEAQDGSDGGRRQGWYADAEEKTYVRSVFLVHKRALPLPLLASLDLPDNNVSCGRRDVTTVAPQALNLLNGEFTLAMARAMAERVARDAGDEPRAQVERSLWLAFSRSPTADELAIGMALMERHTKSHAAAKHAAPAQAALVDWCRALLNTNEFAYVD